MISTIISLKYDKYFHAKESVINYERCYQMSNGKYS